MSQPIQSPSIGAPYTPRVDYCTSTLEEDDHLTLKRNPPCYGYAI